MEFIFLDWSNHMKPKYIDGPVLIHSDIFLTHHLINKNLKSSSDADIILNAHLDHLSDLFGIKNLSFPTFNYDFPKDKIFSIDKTPSQVGALSNHVISKKRLFNRTETPIFSFCVGQNFTSNFENEPFADNSLLSFLFENDGYIVFYGAQINSCTFLHFVESKFGPPRYRYDKKFKGLLERGKIKENTNVTFHVRPLGIGLDYDWDFLLKILRKYNAIIDIDKNVFCVKAREIYKIWGNQIENDDLSILSKNCLKKVKKKLNMLERRFSIIDFEENIQ